jgi:ribosomal protein S18 acetylase RimI-like enzyme
VRSSARTPDFTIRPATAADATAILRCLAAAFAPYREQYTPDGFRDTALTPETIHQRFSQMRVLVAISDAGELVGTVGAQVVDADEGHLRGMAVLPAWAGSGVAQQLLSAAEAELRAAGCTRVTLDTTAPLKRAMCFYEKHGYTRTGRVTDFFGMPLFEYSKELKSSR